MCTQCQPYTCLYLSWMRSTFSGFFFLKDLKTWRQLGTHKRYLQPVVVKFPAENNNEKKDKDDDEGDSDQDHGIVDKHPVCKNI